MAEPLTRSDPADQGAASGGALAEAGARLQRALASLEAAVTDASREGPVSEPQALPPSYLAVELETSRWRERELQAAAAVASEALDHAMTEVRRALQADEADADPDTLDLALESATGAPEDPDEPSPEEDPTE